jgi:penicillin-binding protein 1A
VAESKEDAGAESSSDRQPVHTPKERISIGKRYDGGVLYWTLKLYLFSAFFLLACLGLAAVFTYGYFAKEAPEAPDLTRYSTSVPAISKMYAADGSLLAEFADEWRTVTSYDAIPPNLVNAFLAAEDHDFHEHKGLYFKGIARAVWRNISAGDFAQGGSTITQQVAKQFLSSEKSLTRKAKEAIMARRIEANYSKEAILSVYLNQIYLGNGAYGVRAAAERYFGKKLDELNIGEMATIAGLAQAPSRYSPNHHPERATRRRNEILDRMVLHGFLPAEEGEALKAETLTVKVHRDIFGDHSPYYSEHIRRYVVSKYGVDALQKDGLRIEAAVEPVTDAIAYENVDYGAHKQDKRQGWRGPVTSLDEKARTIFLERAAAMYGDDPLVPGRRYLALVQEVSPRKAQVIVGTETYELPIRNMRWASPWSRVEAINDIEIESLRGVIRVGDVVWVQAEVVNNEEFRGWFLAKGVNPHWQQPPPPPRLEKKLADAVGKVVLDQVPHPQSAIFTGDHETGYVVAMVGGTDFDRSVYNRAYQSCRQPGSTYKPIYYSAAFTHGYGYDTALNDIPRAEIDPVTGEVWVPENFQGTVDNKVSLEYAMVFSKNVASVDVFKKIGADKVEKWARRLGFTTEIIADKALALGASCTKLHELTGAFAVFARNGRSLEWKWVRRILDREGNIVEDNTVYYDPMLSGADRVDRLQRTAGIEDEQAIPARAAYLISKLLRQTIKSGFSSIVRRTGIVSAGKTGTSSATMDNTFVSYTSRWITTVWMGDDVRERPLGLKDAAYMTVEPMWARYMYEAALGHPNLEIPWNKPDGVRENDRGDHSKGKIHEMPLIYIKPPKKPEADAA